MASDHPEIIATPNILTEHLHNSLDQTEPAITKPLDLGINTANLHLNEGDYALSIAPIMLNSEQTLDISANINNLVCLGAQPTWFMGTLLLPKNNPMLAKHIPARWDELLTALAKYNIKAIGGQIEYTQAVQSPIVVGHLVGRAIGNHLLDMRNAEAGDRVLLCQPIGLAGTATIATQYASKLKAHFSESDLLTMQHCTQTSPPCVWPIVKKLLPQSGGLALHSTMNMGIAHALHTIANRTRCGIRIQEDTLPILPQTKKICALLGLDPLGLPSIGALLIICKPELETLILTKLKDEMITQIGELTANATDRLLFAENNLRALPQFDQDEVSRLSQPALL